MESLQCICKGNGEGADLYFGIETGACAPKSLCVESWVFAAVAGSGVCLW